MIKDHLIDEVEKPEPGRRGFLRQSSLAGSAAGGAVLVGAVAQAQGPGSSAFRAVAGRVRQSGGWLWRR